jgi:hypothetical protein
MEEKVKEDNEREEVNILRHLHIAIVQKTITLQKLTSSDDLNVKGLNLNYEKQQSVLGIVGADKGGGGETVLYARLDFGRKNQNLRRIEIYHILNVFLKIYILLS